MLMLSQLTLPNLFQKKKISKRSNNTTISTTIIVLLVFFFLPFHPEPLRPLGTFLPLDEDELLVGLLLE
jgi:hypothetical protein